MSNPADPFILDGAGCFVLMLRETKTRDIVYRVELLYQSRRQGLHQEPRTFCDSGASSKLSAHIAKVVLKLKSTQDPKRTPIQTKMAISRDGLRSKKLCRFRRG